MCRAGLSAFAVYLLRGCTPADHSHNTGRGEWWVGGLALPIPGCSLLDLQRCPSSLGPAEDREGVIRVLGSLTPRNPTLRTVCVLSVDKQGLPPARRHWRFELTRRDSARERGRRSRSFSWFSKRIVSCLFCIRPGHGLVTLALLSVVCDRTRRSGNQRA